MDTFYRFKVSPEQQLCKSYLLGCLRIGMWEGHEYDMYP